MSKAMLLFDNPCSCDECPCFMLFNDIKKSICGVTKRVIPDLSLKPHWCPLLELDMPRMDSILKAINDPLHFHMYPINNIKNNRTQVTENPINMLSGKEETNNDI